MSFDNSNEQRIARLKNRTLNIFHARNPHIPELGRYPLDESTRSMRDLGGKRLTLATPDGAPYDEPCCSSAEICIPPDIASARFSIPIIHSRQIPPYNIIYNYKFVFDWIGFGQVDTYEYQITSPDPYIFIFTGSTSAIIYTQTDILTPIGSQIIIISIIGKNKCGSATATYGLSYPQ